MTGTGVVGDELALPMKDMKVNGPKEDVGHRQEQPAHKNPADTLSFFGSSRESGLTSVKAATRLKRDPIPS